MAHYPSVGVDDVWGSLHTGAVHSVTHKVSSATASSSRSVVEGHTARQNLLVELGRGHHRRPLSTLIVAAISWLMHETTCVCADTRGRGPEDGGNPFGVLAQVRRRVTPRKGDGLK